MLFTREDHPNNPPETWTVRKAPGRRWELVTKDGVVLASTQTKAAALSLTTVGFYVELYEKERRWYAGEPVPGWKSPPEPEALPMRPAITAGDGAEEAWLRVVDAIPDGFLVDVVTNRGEFTAEVVGTGENDDGLWRAASSAASRCASLKGTDDHDRRTEGGRSRRSARRDRQQTGPDHERTATLRNIALSCIPGDTSTLFGLVVDDNGDVYPTKDGYIDMGGDF